MTNPRIVRGFRALLALIVGVAGFLAAGAHLPAHAGGNAISPVHHVPVHHVVDFSPAGVGADIGMDMGAGGMVVAGMAGHEMPTDHDAAKDPRAAHICFFCMTLEEPDEFAAPVAGVSWPRTNAASSFHPTPLPFHPPRLS